MITDIKKAVRFGLEAGKLANLKRQVLQVNSIDEIKKVFSWREEGILARDDIHDFNYDEDLNQRRIRDAEVLSTVMRNLDGKVAIEIGTSTGMGTALMAANGPNSIIHTVNIPPEEILSGAGGISTTIALEKENIGRIYREKGFSNVRQILANTKTWIPEIEGAEVAFIDGCHDTDFVVNDTLKVMKCMRPGGFIMWHDFNPDLVEKFDWIRDVCRGVEKLYRIGAIKNRIYHLKDSWVGLYRI